MSFSQEKRDYLHFKLDEILRLWSRNAGQGYFNLVVNGGIPEFQFGVNLDMGDGLQPEHPPPPQQAHVPTRQDPHAAARHGRVPRRGPARQERNRRRAAAHQAALASKAATAETAVAASDNNESLPAVLFPGQGYILGTAVKTNYHVPPPPPTPVVPLVISTTTSTSVSSSLTSNITITTPLPGKPAVICKDELEGESEEEDDTLFTFCGRCLKSFDSDSDYGCCSRCVKAYHRSCAAGHTCMSYL